ncbi:palmitoyltransferase ZDHHC22-like [Amphiura filiformis]|uniref:palmitoyltransferase ZDHHC22-like n=1 Tax=Amphiura filiformis TaxID=82378 RepID=UPI003B214114
MGLFHIFSMKDAPFVLKVKAVFNILGIAYFTGTVSSGIFIAFFISIPKLVEVHNFSTTKHYVIALFLCINIVGNYLLTALTDTSTDTLQATTCRTSPCEHVHQGDLKGKRSSRGSRQSASSGKRRINHKIWDKSKLSNTDTLTKPWRAYDCILCRSCILKRDHHCFFVGSCIGYHNQKYFIQCCAYLACGCCYSIILTSLYLHTRYGTQFQGAWTFIYLLPLTVISWLQGSTPLGEICLVLFLYIALVGGVVGIGFCLWESHITFLGLTTYEAMHGLTGPKKGSFKDNFCDVFGKYWYIGMLIPIRLPQYGNGTYGQY